MSIPGARTRYDKAKNHFDQITNDKRCPVCGKYAQARYYSEAKKVWIYRHSTSAGVFSTKRGSPTVYHEANR